MVLLSYVKISALFLNNISRALDSVVVVIVILLCCNRKPARKDNFSEKIVFNLCSHKVIFSFTENLQSPSDLIRLQRKNFSTAFSKNPYKSQSSIKDSAFPFAMKINRIFFSSHKRPYFAKSTTNTRFPVFLTASCFCTMS